MNKVYLVVGVPGSGKSWVCAKLAPKFNHVAHDDFKNVDYTKVIWTAAKQGSKPVLAETPFGVSQIMATLCDNGVEVEPVFILESTEVTTQRYSLREGKAIPKGHLTRIETYALRAKQLGAFSGTSQEVLEHLKNV